jgi:hypothetical protein
MPLPFLPLFDIVNILGRIDALADPCPAEAAGQLPELFLAAFSSTKIRLLKQGLARCLNPAPAGMAPVDRSGRGLSSIGPRQAWGEEVRDEA